MLRNLELSNILLQICALHALQILVQVLTGEQAALQVVPVVGLDKPRSVGGEAQFVLVGALSALGLVKGKLISPEINVGNLRRHPGVELLVGKLSAHKLVDLLRVVDLGFVIVEFGYGDILADLSRNDLLLNLGIFSERLLALMYPLILAAFVAA